MSSALSCPVDIEEGGRHRAPPGAGFRSLLGDPWLQCAAAELPIHGAFSDCARPIRRALHRRPLMRSSEPMALYLAAPLVSSTPVAATRCRRF
ncbi:hypothetical protein EVAR_30101_1 [Eumeta japonica]|uniref:Uncharacterized protein n=1 Tax=Eumeta variegata TaxID=151549 RepID=A0A4C1WJU2_EUMVA|nr:hypothetical protein EVAR_30101_1 [Eumeta japonica]